MTPVTRLSAGSLRRYDQTRVTYKNLIFFHSIVRINVAVATSHFSPSLTSRGPELVPAYRHLMRMRGACHHDDRTFITGCAVTVCVCVCVRENFTLK